MLLYCDPNDKEASLKLLEDLTTNADGVQKHVLEEILVLNSKTEYLRGFIDGITDKEAFKRKVPIVVYEDIKHYIERIVKEGPSLGILTGQTITELYRSSGTSGGQRKMIPVTAEDTERRAFFSKMLNATVTTRSLDGLNEGKRMEFMFIKSDLVTSSGLLARPPVTSYFKSKAFQASCNSFTSPYETVMCLDTKQSMYCQLLCGLINRVEVISVGTTFASVFLLSVKFLEEHWEKLVSNIRKGYVSDRITDIGCRNAVMSILGQSNDSNSELADIIEPMFKDKSWQGIVTKLWPRAKFVKAIVTGSMAQYISAMEYYCGGLPIVSEIYASAECYFGFNLNLFCKPCDISYTILPSTAYFEFIPVDKNGSAEGALGDVVDLVDVSLGQYYEPVITTFAGLYRYRVGDILKVTGFHNRTPQFRFIHRRNLILSIDTDKTNEEDLQNAVTRASAKIESFGWFLTEYTSFPDISSIPGHYVLFWELKTRGGESPQELSSMTLEECCYIIEESLDCVYKRLRSNERAISPLEIRVVEYRTFDTVMDFFVSQGSSVSQYKTPRCIKSDEALRILNARVVGNFFSKKAPTWEPQS